MTVLLNSFDELRRRVPAGARTIGAMLAQHGPVPEISITFDPATRYYGFSTRLPGLRPH